MYVAHRGNISGSTMEIGIYGVIRIKSINPTYEKMCLIQDKDWSYVQLYQLANPHSTNPQLHEPTLSSILTEA